MRLRGARNCRSLASLTSAVLGSLSSRLREVDYGRHPHALRLPRRRGRPPAYTRAAASKKRSTRRASSTRKCVRRSRQSDPVSAQRLARGAASGHAATRSCLNLKLARRDSLDALALDLGLDRAERAELSRGGSKRGSWRRRPGRSSESRPASVHTTCSRPGPTPIKVDGRTICSSMNCRYSRAASGRSERVRHSPKILLPAAQLGQLGGRVVQHRLVVGEVIELALPRLRGSWCIPGCGQGPRARPAWSTRAP